MTEPEPANKPNLKVAVSLRARDGRVVRVRHMRREDALLLERLFHRLSLETRYRRFFMPLQEVEAERLQRETQRLATINPANETALIAVLDENEREEAVGVARFVCMEQSRSSCEGSIVMRDDLQGQGVGRQLFDLLVQAALASQLRHMVLVTHAENRAMIGLIKSLGLPFEGRYSAGLYEINLQLADASGPFLPFTNSGG